MQEQLNKVPVSYPYEEEFSIRQVLQKRRQDLGYLMKFKLRIFLAMVAGGLLGALIAWWWPVTYTARTSFVVEESKGGGGSLVSALAGQFGFDLGSMGSTGGVLAGDNVQELLHSEKLIKNTLLTPYAKEGGLTLAERYTKVYQLDKKWLKYTKNKPVTFPANTSGYTRVQDSLLHLIINTLNEKELAISKPDKKLSFFQLNVTTRDEKFSQLFCTRLLKAATDFYISTKTTRLRTNVNRLQARADSIGRVLNRKTYSASAANQILLDVNPAYPTVNVGAELQERDKIVLSTIYSEVVKNLEVSKTMLIQETPTFQVVDEPELPLKKNRLGYGKGLAGGMILAAALYALYLLVLRPREVGLN